MTKPLQDATNRQTGKVAWMVRSTWMAGKSWRRRVGHHTVPGNRSTGSKLPMARLRFSGSIEFHPGRAVQADLDVTRAGEGSAMHWAATFSMPKSIPVYPGETCQVRLDDGRHSTAIVVSCEARSGATDVLVELGGTTPLEGP